MENRGNLPARIDGDDNSGRIALVGLLVVLAVLVAAIKLLT